MRVYYKLLILSFIAFGCCHKSIRIPASSEVTEETKVITVETYGHYWDGDQFSPVNNPENDLIPTLNPQEMSLSKKYGKTFEEVKEITRFFKKISSFHGLFDLELGAFYNFEDEDRPFLNAIDLTELTLRLNTTKEIVKKHYLNWMDELFNLKSKDIIHLCKHFDNKESLSKKLQKHFFQRYKKLIHKAIGIEDLSSLTTNFIFLSIVFDKTPKKIILLLKKIKTPKGFHDKFHILVNELTHYLLNSGNLNRIKKKLKNHDFTSKNFLYAFLSKKKVIEKIPQTSKQMPFPWNVYEMLLLEDSSTKKVLNDVHKQIIELSESGIFPKNGLHYNSNLRPFMMTDIIYHNIQARMASIKLVRVIKKNFLKTKKVLQDFKLLSNAADPVSILNTVYKVNTDVENFIFKSNAHLKKITSLIKKLGYNVIRTEFGDYSINKTNIEFRYNLEDLANKMAKAEIEWNIPKDNLYRPFQFKNDVRDIFKLKGQLQEHIKNISQTLGEVFKRKYAADVDFVYDIFKDQLTSRVVFNPKFISALRMEDDTLYNERLTHFTFKSNGDIVAFFGLYDGTIKTSEIQQINEARLPLERQIPGLILPERITSTPVIEVRRLAVSKESSFEFDRLLTYFSKFLEKNKMEDAILYAHTDRLGKIIFKRKAGMTILENTEQYSKKSGKFILRVEASKFIQKMNKKNISHNCYDLIRHFLKKQ